MRLGDDKAEIVEDVANSLPAGGNGDAESDGENALASAAVEAAFARAGAG